MQPIVITLLYYDHTSSGGHGKAVQPIVITLLYSGTYCPSELLRNVWITRIYLYMSFQSILCDAGGSADERRRRIHATRWAIRMKGAAEEEVNTHVVIHHSRYCEK